MKTMRKLFAMLVLVISIMAIEYEPLQAEAAGEQILLLDTQQSMTAEDKENMKYALTGVGILGIMALITEMKENKKGLSQ